MRAEDHVTSLVQFGLTGLSDLSPDLLDGDGFTVNLSHLLALLPGPRLEPGHLALLLSVQHACSSEPWRQVTLRQLVRELYSGIESDSVQSTDITTPPPLSAKW